MSVHAMTGPTRLGILSTFFTFFFFKKKEIYTIIFIINLIQHL